MPPDRDEPISIPVLQAVALDRLGPRDGRLLMTLPGQPVPEDPPEPDGRGAGSTG